MKHLHKNEANLRFKNFKDMTNWSAKEEDVTKFTGKKNLDLKLGQKVIDLFAEYNLFITVDEGEWIKKQDLLLPDETNLKEYRVKIGFKPTYEDWFEGSYYSETPDDKSDDDLREEYEKIQPDYEDGKPEWSVFLPVGITNIESAAMADSSKYLKILLGTYPDIIKFYIDTQYGGILSDNPKGFKYFINEKDVKITNKNVEVVNTINNRLYKDSKVFGCFRSEIFDGEYETKEFFNEWLKLIK